MINLNQLRSFYMAVKHGSIKIAAEKMFVTPPAVTMQIKKLEMWLGFPLLQKENNRLKVRKEAIELYAYTETIFSNVEQLEQYLHKHAADKKNRLIIGTHHMVARYMAPKLVDYLKKVQPSLQVKIVLGTIPDLVKKIMDYEIHCILLSRKPHPDKIQTVPLFQEDMVLVAAADSKYIDSWRINPKDICLLPLLMLEHDTNIHSIITRYLKINGVVPNITQDNLSGDVILGFLLQDAGVAFSLRFIMQESIEKGVLREIEVVGGLPKAEFGLAFLNAKSRSPHLEPLVSWFMNTTLTREQLM